MNFFYKIALAFRILWIVYKNPIVFNENNIKLILALYETIFKVASERTHQMLKIGTIYPGEDEQKEIVSLWAGAGVGANPMKRIEELIEENSLLKLKLQKMIMQKYVSKDNDI